MEWNGDVCVRNKITTFAAPIYLLKFTISGVTEQRQSQWRQNDLNPRIFAKAGERQMKSPDVDNILEDRNKTQLFDSNKAKLFSEYAGHQRANEHKP